MIYVWPPFHSSFLPSLLQTGRTCLCFLFDVGFMYLHKVIHNHLAKGMCPHHIIILQLRKFSLPQSYEAQWCFKLSPQYSFWFHLRHKAAVVLQRDFVACLVKYLLSVDWKFLGLPHLSTLPHLKIFSCFSAQTSHRCREVQLNGNWMEKKHVIVFRSGRSLHKWSGLTHFSNDF